MTDPAPMDEPKDALLVFIAYARDQGQERVASEFMGELSRRLKEWRVTSWSDLNIIAGDEPVDAIDAALKQADLLLYIMTRRSMNRAHYSRKEILSAEEAGTTVIVLEPEPDHPDFPRPTQIQNHFRIAFAGPRWDDGWAVLKQQLEAHATVAGQIVRAEAKRRALRRRRDANPESASVFDQHLAQVDREISVLYRRRATAPSATRQQQQIDAAQERERTPRRPSTSRSPIPSVGEPPATAPGTFQNRLEVIESLERQLGDLSTRLVSVVGHKQGIGKTAMIRKLWERMEELRTVDAAGRVYLSAEQFEPISAQVLLESLLRFAVDADATVFQFQITDPIPWVEKAALVLEAVSGQRVMVVLDSVEEILGDDSEIRDPSLREVVDYLVLTPGHGVVLLLVGRREAHKLGARGGSVARRNSFSDGLSQDFAWRALQAMAPHGWSAPIPASDEDVRWLQMLTGGSPRALELAASAMASDSSLSWLISLLQSLRRGDESADMATLLFARAFERLSTVERRTIQALAAYRRPVSPEAVDFLLQTYVTGIDSGPLLRHLHAMRLVRCDGDYYYLPPTAESDYVLGTLPHGNPGDGVLASPPLTYAALLHRGAEWFASIRVDAPRRVGDLRAHLAEIELRVRAAEYEQALELMGEVDDDYLLPWGYSAALLPFIERLLDSDAVDPTLRVRALSLIARALMREELYEAAIRHLELALSNAGLSSYQRTTLSAQLASAYLGSEQLGRAERTSRAVLRAAFASGRTSDLAQAISTRAEVHLENGKIETALFYLRAAARLGLRSSSSNGTPAASLDVTIAWMHQLLGEYKKAHASLLRSHALEAKSPRSLSYARCLVMEAQLLVHDPSQRGSINRAIDMASEAAGIALAAGSWRLCRDAKEVQALACLCLNDIPGAENASRAACRHRSSVIGWGLRGLVAFRAKDDEGALAAFRNGNQLAQEKARGGLTSYSLLDNQGLIACGLALLDDRVRYLPISLKAYRTARSYTNAKGVIADTLLLIAQFGPRADQRLLEAVGAAASGSPE